MKNPRTGPWNSLQSNSDESTFLRVFGLRHDDRINHLSPKRARESENFTFLVC